MQRRTLGKTGLSVSAVGFGSAPVGILAVEQPRITLLLNVLLDEGVNLIDTAAAYAGAEEAIGQAVSDRRREYVLVSKCGSPGSGKDDPSWSTDEISESVEQSLKKLKTDYLDVMLLHSCSLETLQRGEAVSTLLRARDAGKLRHVGYSGDNQAAAFACSLPEVSVVETSINICDQRNIDAVLPEAERHEAGVIAKRPIANAAWKDLREQRGFYQEYAETYTKRLTAMPIEPQQFGLGQSRESWPELALRFTLSNPAVHSAIVGSTNPDHARSNIAAAAKGSLPNDAFQKLRDAFREGEQRSGQHWTAQT